MSSLSIIPTIPANQQFNVALNGISYQFRLLFVKTCWLLDINTANGTPIVAGLPLVSGIDLLSQLQHLDLGGQLFNVSTGTDSPATFENLGINSQLYWLVP